MNEEKVTYNGEKISIGIDVHRSFFVLSAVCEGRLIKRWRIVSRAEVLVKFVKTNFPGASVRCCYEAGFSGFWLHRYLERQGIANIVVNPASIETGANNRVKTDKRDSLKMAIQLDANRLIGIRVPSEEQECRRLLHRTREQLMRARARARIQIRMKLHQFGLLPSSITTVLTDSKAKELIEQVSQAELKTVLRSLLSQWEHLNREIKKLDKDIKTQAAGDELDAKYRSVAGVGPLIAQILSNELGDMSQFANVRALYSYTGLTPCEHSSGDSIRRGHISRQGNSRLRHVLVEAAWRAIRKDPALKNAFEQIAKTRGKKIAIVAIARKLVGRIRAVMKTTGTYQCEYNKAA